MSKKKWFKKEVFDVGEVAPDGKATAVFEAEELTEDDFKFTWPGCGCSDAWWEDGKIYMTIDIAQAASGGGWADGRNPLNKYAFVRIKDGTEDFVAGEKKRRKTNNERQLIRLQAFGVVVK